MTTPQLIGMLSLTFGSCSSPETRLNTLVKRFPTEAIQYFPQLVPEVSAQTMPIPDAAWYQAAQTWSNQFLADIEAVNTAKLTKTQQKQLLQLVARAKEASKLTDELDKNATLYNIQTWLQSIASGKNTDKYLTNAMKQAPKYYLAAADRLTALRTQSVPKTVAVHQVLFEILAKHPSAEADDAILAAKNYLAWCVSKRSSVLLGTGKHTAK